MTDQNPALEAFEWLIRNSPVPEQDQDTHEAVETIRAALQSQAEPAGEGGGDPELRSMVDGIREQEKENSGFWNSCSGCHESNEGYPTGPYSEIFKCHLGVGCSECGGIGAVWDNTDYEDMARFMMKMDEAEGSQEAQAEQRENFAYGQAMDEAPHKTFVLSGEDFDKFKDNLENPKEPTPELVSLMKGKADKGDDAGVDVEQIKHEVFNDERIKIGAPAKDVVDVVIDILEQRNLLKTNPRQSVPEGVLALVVDRLRFIENGCLVPPDGGSPDIYDYMEAGREALDALRPYLSATPTPAVTDKAEMEKLEEALEAARIYRESGCLNIQPLSDYWGKHKKYPHEIINEMARAHLETIRGK